jgi:peptidoglycan/xylan/chitin deacetylase (PgdA/CDA1 family)
LLAALGAASFAAYEVLEQPTTQVFGKTVTHGPADERLVALTYDDGPNPPYTQRILDVLDAEHVHATFFVVGRAVQAYPAIVRREYRDGDAVGDHTWAHDHLLVLSPAQIRRTLQRTNSAIYRATGKRTSLLRPPFGARDWTVMHIAKQLGYTVVMWSVPLAYDWQYPSARTIAARVLPNVSDGSIIVLHDGNRGLLCGPRRLNPRVCDRSSDIEATRLIVDALKARGFRFVTIPQLIAAGKAAMHTSAPGVE